MALTRNQIITLCMMKGYGSQTVIKIGETAKAFDITPENEDELYRFVQDYWKRNRSKKTVDFQDLKASCAAVELILKENARHGIGVMTYFDDAYPELLRQIEKSPAILYYKGNLDVLKKPGMAIIGTRKPTPSGIKAGKYFAGEFAKRGFNIVSGLALGCDTSAHEGALSVGGSTTAILGNGLDSVFPPENKRLADSILMNGGLLLSEYPIGTKVSRFTLVDRDRLQAGMSKATIVIQTSVNGGTMHASRATLESSKPLFAIKYKQEMEHESVVGNQLLVEKGAKWLTSADDLDIISAQIIN